MFIKRDEVVEDFIRNFFTQMNLNKTLDEFNQEYAELSKKGRFNDNYLGPITDIYIKNAKLEEKLERMQKELENLDVKDKKQYNTDLITALEVINMVEICILVVKSAIIRRESRGAHFRSDFPETLDEWKKSIVINKNKIEFEAR